MAIAKPSNPVLNTSHPFALSAVALLPLSEGTGQPAIIQGPHGGSAPTTTVWAGTPATWITNSEGAGLRFSLLTSGLLLGVNDINGTWFPTIGTVLLVRGKLDGTLPVERFFRADGGTVANIYLPYNDGVVYFDWGSTSAPNRLTKSGLTFSTSSIDKWVFTAGASGSAIWQNGAKEASQSTGISRTAGTYTPVVGYAAEAQDVNFFQVNDTVWDDATILAWFADPYAHLTTSAHRFLSVGGVG